MNKILNKAAAQGRHGDDRLAHINGYEAAVLKSLGGAGTKNPKTGLEEYYLTDGSGGMVGGGGHTTPGRGALRDDSDRGHEGQGGRGGPGAVGMGSFGGLPGEPTRDEMQQQDQIGANVAHALDDYNNQGNFDVENFGNRIASLFGFNEMDPTAPGFSHPGMPGVTGQANWGFDPAGLIGSAIGAAGGVPLMGLVADQISSAFGRPLEVNLGPSVFGGTTQTADGVDIADGSSTYTGGNVTVRDPGDQDTYLGVSPTQNAMLQGINRVAPAAAPGSTTVTGADPAPAAPVPADPTEPTIPDVSAPEPIDASNVNVNPGNTGLTDSQLTSLFLNYMPRTYTGRNRPTVVG